MEELKLRTNFIPFPELHTQRLILRKLSLDDAPELYFLRSNPAVLKYLGRKPAESISAVKDFIQQVNQSIDEGQSILWAIAFNAKPRELIGTICFWNVQPENLRAEIGYVLHPDYWGKSIMKEAINEVMHYGFHIMNLHSVEARLSAGNQASVALLEKTGFKKDGYFREDLYFEGAFSDSVVYGKLVSDQ